MLNELLEGKLKLIQYDYKKLLKKLFTKLNSSDYLLVIDEINVFWYLRRKIVNLILENISPEQDCYVLMAASYLDIMDNEHFPFICLGRTHVIDDTLCHFAKTAEYGNIIILSEKIKEQITLAMQDNINILENFSDIISILPITLLYDQKDHRNLIYKASMQLISSMFNIKFNGMKDFSEKFSSYEDIKNALSVETQNQLIFTDVDDKNLDFDRKIKRYVEENESLIPSHKSESQIFFLMIFQYICQAFDILLKCAQFNIVPYIRFDVAYQYLIIISCNFLKIPQMQEIIFKSVCAHVMYEMFDKGKIVESDFIMFRSKLEEYGFSEKVLKDLKEQDIKLNNGSLYTMMEVIDKHLINIFYVPEI